jgi:hypothetical protein
MTKCTGSLAELNSLPYIEGTLSAREIEQFEEHYFDCPVCLARLQAIQAVGLELARNPIALPAELEPRSRLGWPVWFWSAGAISAMLLVSVFTYKRIEVRPGKPTGALSQPQSPPQTQVPSQPAAKPVHLSQLADLTLPAFRLPNLRGESLDAHFEAGMKEYTNGNCSGTVAALAQVPAESGEARAAAFYSGACQMHLGDYASASQLLRNVANAGDSPQQEAALYELAQIALVGNDPATANAYLKRTIALRGDLEGKARKQRRRMTALTGQGNAVEGKNSEAK